MGAFLREHQAIAAPIIEWGGLFLFLFVILSPFLVIRHQYFKPTRWWHILSAYGVSFLFAWFINRTLITAVPGSVINNLGKINLDQAYTDLKLNASISLLLVYPLFVFYSTRMLYGSLTLKTFLLSLSTAILLAIALLGVGVYWTVTNLSLWF